MPSSPRWTWLAAGLAGAALVSASCARDPGQESSNAAMQADASHSCPGEPPRLLASPSPGRHGLGVRRLRTKAVAAVGSRPPRGPAGKVVIISVDGLRPDAIFRAPAPNLLALACRGAYSWTARSVTPTVTLPNHASMVSGYVPEQHMMFHDHLEPGFLGVPTVMGVARAAGRRVAIVVGKAKMVQLAAPETFDVYQLDETSDEAVVDKAVAQAAAGFDVMFLHLPHVDLVGHGQGWMSEAYLRQVQAADAALGRFLSVLPSDVTVIVTADHGGYQYVHWSGHPDDAQIPWIVAGPKVRAGHALRAAIWTVDTAATAASVVGLSLGAEVIGRAVDEAFAPP